MNITEVDESDQDVWRMFGEGRVKGCFQIEGSLGKHWCKAIKPTSILELADVISIIRPGCISGDTLITVQKYLHKDKKHRYVRKSIKDLCDGKTSPETIYSIDEASGSLNAIENNLLDVFYSGKKECFRVNVRKYSMSGSCKNNHPDWYNLECTADHKLLRSDMEWVELQHLNPGDRIAIYKKKNNRSIRSNTICNRHHPKAPRQKNIEGTRYFHEICYKHYHEECVMCGWDETTLDVHHINGNRHTNNHYENLAFLCPNCHRKQSKGLISNEEIVSNRDGLYLPISDDIEWATYTGNESVGIKDTYDISMSGPNHNFIAGNFIVHNCLKAFADGKSMTQHYADRKNGKDEVPSLHPSIDSVVDNTYGVIVYQEQAMEIAVKMAGFNLKEADDLRKAIGKKKADLMSQIRVKFLEGASSNGIPDDVSTRVFDMIEKSARYSFNKSHAVAYAKISYWSAYLRYYRFLKFTREWMRDAKEKINPDLEKRQLILAAMSEGILFRGPSIRLLEEDFTMSIENDEHIISFGLCNIKNVGSSDVAKLRKKIKDIEIPVERFNWTLLLIHILTDVNKRAVKSLISAGAFSGFGQSRTRMLHDFECISEGLTKGEINSIREYFNVLDVSVTELIERFLGRGLKKEGGFISRISRMNKVQEILLRLQNPGRDLSDSPVTYSREEERLLGYAINYSELTACSNASHANATCLQVSEGRRGNCIVAAMITRLREHRTSKGDLMAFVSAEDNSGELENIVIFPDLYEQNKAIIYERSTVLLSGEVKDFERNSFIVDRIFEI